MEKQNINIKEFIPALIDDKNVQSDALIESIFDDDEYIWKKDIAVGFIDGVPSYALYHKSMICINIIDEKTSISLDPDKWTKEVIERLTGMNYEELPKRGERVIDYYCSETNLLTSIDIRANKLIVRFWERI